MRFSLPNARIMVHQPSGGFQGQATDIMLHAQEILNLKKRLNEIYVKHTGQPYKTIEDALERDKFLTAEHGQGFRPGRQGDRQAPRRIPAPRRPRKALQIAKVDNTAGFAGGVFVCGVYAASACISVRRSLLPSKPMPGSSGRVT